MGRRYGYYMGWFSATIYFPGMTSALAWVSARYTLEFITSAFPDFPLIAFKIRGKEGLKHQACKIDPVGGPLRVVPGEGPVNIIFHGILFIQLLRICPNLGYVIRIDLRQLCGFPSGDQRIF